jgi:hypothetical protein
MSSALDRLRNKRLFWQDCGEVKLQLRRPTDEEALDLAQASQGLTERHAIDIACKYTVGFHPSVTERILFGGDSDDPVPYSNEIVREWLSEHCEYWLVICDALITKYREHKGIQEDDAKN